MKDLDNSIFPNYNFLKKYQEMQLNVTFDGFIELGYARIGYSKTDKSDFWNYALPKWELNHDELNNLEKSFKEISTNPAIYFENTASASNLTKLLTTQGYKKSFEDSWQFWKGMAIENKHFESVRRVQNSNDLGIFLKTFNDCYQKDDPQNPYGELGDYLKSAEAAWHKNSKSNKIEYFIVYKSEQAVAVSSLTNYKGIGYISNVGSLREVRGEGYGKAATLYCVKKSLENGNTEHCLATEEGHYPNEFYKKIGFDTRFTALAYSKKLN